MRPGQQHSTLSKVGAATRNARCEADNFNSDKPEGSRRGAVYSHISKSAFAPSTDILQCVFNVRNVPTTEVALIRSSRPNGRASFCDGHSGSPARRNPSSYRERSSARQGPSTALRLETRSTGFSRRSRAMALCACSGRPAIALLAASIRNPG